MPRRYYVGPHPEVEVPYLDTVLTRGEAIDVTTEQAEALDASPLFGTKPAPADAAGDDATTTHRKGDTA